MKTGAILNSPDTRDIHGSAIPVTATNPNLPIIDSVLPTFPILDQGQYGTCPNYDVVRQMQRYWFAKTGKLINFSPRFLVIMGKMNNYDGFPDSQGTQPRFPMTLAVNVGCCTTDILPDDTTLSWEEYINPAALTPAVMDEASKWKMPAYATFGSDVASLRSALQSCVAVGITLPVGNFDTARLLPPAAITSETEYHRVTLYGDVPFDGNNGDFVANQWGASWGDDGMGVFKLSDFAGMIYDVMAFSEQIPAALVASAQATPKNG